MGAFFVSFLFQNDSQSIYINCIPHFFCVVLKCIRINDRNESSPFRNLQASEIRVNQVEQRIQTYLTLNVQRENNPIELKKPLAKAS
jgi:hypothetical protein